MDFFQKGKECYDEKNYDKAIEWYLKADAQNDHQAQNNLGCIYVMGKGVDQDYVIAMEWFMKAANKTNYNTNFNIGYLYRIGRGVDKDYTKAMKCR